MICRGVCSERDSGMDAQRMEALAPTAKRSKTGRDGEAVLEETKTKK